MTNDPSLLDKLKNLLHWKKSKKFYAEKLNITSDRTNKEVSTAVASWLLYNDGIYHWNASKHCWKY